MKKLNQSLVVLMYSILFGAVIAQVTGSPLAGVVCFGLALFSGSVVKLPKGSLGMGATTEEDEVDYVKAINEKVTEFKNALDKKADSNEIERLKLELGELREKANDEQRQKTEDTITDLKEKLIAVGEEVNKLKNPVEVSKEVKSLGEAMAKAYADNIEKIKANTNGFISMTVKAAGTMTRANYSGGTVGLSDLEPGFTRVVRRNPFLRQLVNSGTTSSQYVVWVEQANPDPGAAGMTAEGVAKTQTDFDIVERSMEVRKITAYIKVSKEMLADIPFIQSEINNELVELVQLKLDEQILSGAGTGNNMKGILEYAQAFAAISSLAGQVDDANNFDVLRAAIAQIEVANLMPNYIVLNPADVAAMDLEKATDGHYVMPPFASTNGTTISGLRIIANTGVTAGDFLVGDFTKSNLRMREEINIQVGYENDDFTKNLLTILAEARAVHYVKTNHANAFVTGDFTSAKAELETP